MASRARSGSPFRGLAKWGVVAGVLLVGILVGSALSQRWNRAGGEGSRSEAGRPQVGERVRVEVLNGGGVRGAARSATSTLREAGFDVVTYQNAENFSEEASVVLDRVGRLELARSVASALGITDVRSEPDSTLLLEVTVRIGPEWQAGSGSDPSAGLERPWWDPRGYIGGPPGSGA